MRISFRRLAVASSLALLSSSLAPAANAQPVTPDTPPPGQEQPAPGTGAQPDESCTAQPGGTQSGTTRDEKSLTGRLADCNGVLAPPPAQGSEIQVPTPDTGTTPVLPPGSVPEQPAQ